MASLAQAPSTMASVTVPKVHHRGMKLFQPSISLHGFTFPHIRIKHPPVCCTKLTPWEPSPVTYSPTDEKGSDFLRGTSNIFETLNSDDTAEAPVTNTEELIHTSNQSSGQLQFLKWPMWLLGPSLLLATGMVPTLWLPISSIFLGPNIASLLSLIGLDCIFNLGATLFLLMADACARPKT